MADDKFIVSDSIGKTGKVLSRLIGPTFDIAENLTTISEVASSSTAMNAIAKSSIASAAINAAIQNYRSALLSALADTSKFTKTTALHQKLYLIFSEHTLFTLVRENQQISDFCTSLFRKLYCLSSTCCDEEPN